jgi:hypothetical protein
MQGTQSVELTGEGFTVQNQEPSRVVFRGTVSMRDPSRVVGGYLRRIHDTAVASKLPEVTVELRELKFMNSSGLRVFLEWVENIRTGAHRYRLRLRINKSVSWQRSSFFAIADLAPEFVTVEST